MGGVGIGRRSGWGAALLIPLLFFAWGLAAAEPADPPRLVYADNGAWRSDLMVANQSTSLAPTIVRGTNCPFGPSGFNLHLPPDRTMLIKEYGRYLCGPRIGLIAYETAGLPVISVYARYRDADGNATAFEIPPLTWVLRQGRVAEIPMVRNDLHNETTLILFNEGEHPTAVRAAVFDWDGSELAVETIDVPPGLTVYPIETEVVIGRLELTQGLPIGCGFCTWDEPVYGFAAVGVRGQGSQRVIPLGPKLRFAPE